MRILELFSGYGTATFALKRLGIEHEIVGYSDIDKYANQCFKMNHGSKQLGDVREIRTIDLPDFDLLTGGFPCQSFSNAGKMQGEADPRGSLFYEIIRIAEVKQPKYMLLENVKGLTCKKFKDTFSKIIYELNRIGYNVYWKVLNSKDYGIPQSRARIWFVCFRKDIDKGKFQFPQPKELKIKSTKDILEKEVDKKYYLSPLLQERFAKYLEDKNNKIGKEQPAILDLYNHKIKTDGTSITLSDPCHNNLRLIEGKVFDKAQGKTTDQIYEINEENDLSRPSYIQYQNGHHSEAYRVYNQDGIIQTIKTIGLKIYESGRKEWRTHELSPTLKNRMGTGGNKFILVNNEPKIANCLDANMHKGTTPERFYDKSKRNIVQTGQLRRLTPKECFRLMGFLNDEIKLDGLSDTQRYKLAGNGQDVNMVTLIFKEMFKNE